jgi:hypothetical protein
METVGSRTLWSYASKNISGGRATCQAVREYPGKYAASYLDLARMVSELQYRNPDHVLMFRGQGSDHKDSKGRTTLPPSIFRGRSIDHPSGDLPARFDRLRRAEQALVTAYSDAGLNRPDRLKKYRILRWAILQHYEIVPTPLLDLTHSLRIAVSFAAQANLDSAYIFALAVPQISGAITASAEDGLQMIRLSSVCPPEAVRPHIQEGYLLGEYPELGDFEQKALYPRYEIDCAHRLIAKFSFRPELFRKDGNFPIVPPQALYPDEQSDPLRRMSEQIKREL